jgi:hypothetical protein
MSVINMSPRLKAMFDALDSRIRKLELSQVFQAPASSADPLVLRDGMIWYRTDIDQFKVYQNGIVTSLIEGTEGAWTSYVPVVSGTGWAIGNGTRSGAYCRFGKTIHFRASIIWGSTSTFGAGILTVTLPVANISTTANLNFNVGYFDSGTLYVGNNNYQTVSTIGLLAVTNSVGALGAVTSTSPFTWGSGDIVYISGTYESA